MFQSHLYQSTMQNMFFKKHIYKYAVYLDLFYVVLVYNTTIIN